MRRWACLDEDHRGDHEAADDHDDREGERVHAVDVQQLDGKTATTPA
ncbi:hypothetical protein [Nonomuraea dietziae]